MIALLPIFILSFAIIVLLIALFVYKLETKKCAILATSGLICALICSSILGLLISYNTPAITDISSDNMQISVDKSQDTKSQNTTDTDLTNEQTIAEIGRASCRERV